MRELRDKEERNNRQNDDIGMHINHQFGYNNNNHNEANNIQINKNEKRIIYIGIYVQVNFYHPIHPDQIL